MASAYGRFGLVLAPAAREYLLRFAHLELPAAAIFRVEDSFSSPEELVRTKPRHKPPAFA